jgi:hypothetical protein
MTEPLTKDAFAPLLHKRFTLPDTPDQSLALELIEVSGDDHATALTKGHEYFALKFRGPAQVFLPQRTYRLAHEELGTHEVFLVPVAQDAEGFYYEAVFNRLL